MSSSDKLTLAQLPVYWDAVIKQIKELTARVAQNEARLGELAKEAPPAAPEEEAPGVEAEL